jgi:hypothetical protein
MKAKSSYFKTSVSLAQRINEYFIYIKGEHHQGRKSVKTIKTIADGKIWDREPEPATISGMALFLGFSSKQEFEIYEETGKYATILKQGRLRIEAAYEARLYQTPTGVIFALKTMGWTDKPEVRKPTTATDNTLKVEIINTGLLPAANEKEVTF